MTLTPQDPKDRRLVLIVEDQIGDMLWLTDLIEDRGYGYVVAPSEKQARLRLDAVKGGTERYVLAIVDVMVSTLDIAEILELPDLDPQYFQDSKDTGIRVCEYARRALKLSAETLPILCCTARVDAKVWQVMKALGIPYFRKDYENGEESIRDEIEKWLPPRQ